MINGLPVLPRFHNVPVAYDPWQLRLARCCIGHGQHGHAYIVLLSSKGSLCLRQQQPRGGLASLSPKRWLRLLAAMTYGHAPEGGWGCVWGCVCILAVDFPHSLERGGSTPGRGRVLWEGRRRRNKVLPQRGRRREGITSATYRP